jgi:hypothetical protein
MTSPHDRSFEVVQERDAVASRKVTLIVIATIVISVASVAVAGAILRARRAALSFHEPAFASAAPRQIDAIHQTLIARDRHGELLRDAQRRALDEYRFVDRQRGVAQIPIERAMQIVVDQAAKDAGGPR